MIEDLPAGREAFAAAIGKGYWQDLPLTHLITVMRKTTPRRLSTAKRSYSYREFNHLVDNLASSLQRLGLKRGEAALVQLGNVAEFYINFSRCCALAWRSGQRAVQPSA